MGKFTRKARIALDVAVMDVSQACLGVRTRAKTLALQRLHPAAAPPSNTDVCYLELRSRRLEKHTQRQNSRAVRRVCGCKTEVEVGEHGVGFRSSSIEGEGLGAEVRGNDWDCDARGRGTRESTPCNAITAANTMTAPSSTTKRTCMGVADQRVRRGHLMNCPSAVELDEFFTPEEQSLQHHFINKYNFDIINDMPLPGRFEWVEVRP